MDKDKLELAARKKRDRLRKHILIFVFMMFIGVGAIVHFVPESLTLELVVVYSIVGGIVSHMYMSAPYVQNISEEDVRAKYADREIIEKESDTGRQYLIIGHEHLWMTEPGKPGLIFKQQYPGKLERFEGYPSWPPFLFFFWVFFGRAKTP